MLKQEGQDQQSNVLKQQEMNNILISWQTTPRKEGNKNSNTDENDIDEVTTRSNVEINLEGMTKQAVALKQWYNTDKRTLL